MNVLVVGAGAVGGYFGARLAQSGVTVTFLARGATLDALKSLPLRVESPLGDVAIRVGAVADARELAAPDLILAATKSWQLADAARALATVAGPSTVVLPLLNGVDAHEVIASHMKGATVLAGTCAIMAERVAPAHVVHRGATPSVTFGRIGAPSVDPVVARIADVFRAAGVRPIVADDVLVALWDKFAFVTAMGGVGALARVPIGLARAVPETRELLERAVDETLALARARGVRMPDERGREIMSRIDALPVEGVASMHRDIVEGRPSELDAWNGAIVRMARAVNVAVPTHDLIWRALAAQERIARGESNLPTAPNAL